MSLSDPERIQGIYYTINEMMKEKEELEKNELARDNQIPDYIKDELENLLNLIDCLWVEALRSEKNALHWVLGSDSGKLIDGNPSGLWGVAVNGHIHNMIRELEGRNFSEVAEEIYDAFECNLSIEGLLDYAKNGRILSFVFKMFRCSENLIYNLRRYNDKFLSEYEKLDALISRIRGECFGIFENFSEFATAYLVNNLCKELYNYKKYPYHPEDFDAVTKFLVKNCVHHDLSTAMELSLEEVSHIHMQFEASKKNMMDRLLTAIRLCNRRYGQDFNAKELMNFVKKNKTLKKRTKEVETVLKWCEEKQKDHEKQQSYGYEPTRLVDVYGVCHEPEDLLELFNRDKDKPE